MKTRNKIIIGICVSVIIIGLCTYFILKIVNGKEEINSGNQYAVEDDCINEEYMYETGMFEEDVEASSAEEKVSPNATLIIKKKHKDCGHISEETVALPSEMVNKTQEEIENEYKDFEVEAFSSNEVILYKEIDGACNEHFKIKEEDGVIVVYSTNENGEEVLYDKTGISTEYLTESDLSNIRNGLEIYGKENLNKFIEDFE